MGQGKQDSALGDAVAVVRPLSFLSCVPREGSRLTTCSPPLSSLSLAAIPQALSAPALGTPLPGLRLHVRLSPSRSSPLVRSSLTPPPARTQQRPRVDLARPLADPLAVQPRRAARSAHPPLRQPPRDVRRRARLRCGEPSCARQGARVLQRAAQGAREPGVGRGRDGQEGVGRAEGHDRGVMRAEERRGEGRNVLEKVARCPTTRRLGAAVASSLCFAVTLYIAEQALALGRAAQWRRSAFEA